MPAHAEPRSKVPATAVGPQPSLRERAEARLPLAPAPGAGAPGEDPHATLHELRVHQVELEIQNEELRSAQVELAESRDHYADLSSLRRSATSRSTRPERFARPT